MFFVVKVDLLKNKLGFDEAFNYKEEADLNVALERSAFNNSGINEELIWQDLNAAVEQYSSC